MPICITCSTPVKNLYTTYSKADDRSLGKGVRLTQCPNCKRFADKYVEHDYVVLFIDLVLIKPQVYRHLLFNRLNTPPDAFDPSILRLGILLILFDVYITWARIERTNSSSSNNPIASLSFSLSGSDRRDFSSAPIIIQYFFFLTLNVVATVVQHVVIRVLARRLVGSGLGWLVTSRRGNEVEDGPAGGGLTGHSYGSGGSETQQQRQYSRSNNSPSKLKGQRGQSPLSETKMDLSTVPGTGSYNGQGQAAATTAASAMTQNEGIPRISPIPNANNKSFSSLSSKRRIQPTSMDRHRNTTVATSLNDTNQAARPGAQASPSAISTALLVSSCTKLFPILLVIWPTATGQMSDKTADTQGSSSSSSSSLPPTSSSLAPFAYRATSHIGWVVLVNNIEALLILLDCGYVVATILAVAGLLSRWLVEGVLLSSVGLVREMEGPIGDVLGIWGWIVATIQSR